LLTKGDELCTHLDLCKKLIWLGSIWVNWRQFYLAKDL